MFDAKKVASTLTIGQKSCVKGMIKSACVLGCSEPWAERMRKPNSRRPALTFRERGQEQFLYGLTDFGAEVKKELETSDV